MKAFPNSTVTGKEQEGMDLRDYFAAKFMQAFITTFYVDVEFDGYEYADLSYQLAHAMMKARER